MKKRFVIPSLLLLSLSLTPFAVAKDAKLDTYEEKLGYAIGSDFGASMKQNVPEISLEAAIAGLADAFEGKELKLTAEDLEAIKQEATKRMREKAKAEWVKMADENLAKGEAFLAENGKKSGVTTTDSGLQYVVLEEGKGEKPGATDVVTVHYKGTLLDGTVFDSSYSRNQPATFPLNGVIPGWTEGLQLMKKGAKYTFYIPSKLAYGPRGMQGAIGPNAMLTFEVELIDIEKNPKAEEAAKEK